MGLLGPETGTVTPGDAGCDPSSAWRARDEILGVYLQGQRRRRP
jgi:hypothetical protein